MPKTTLTASGLLALAGTIGVSRVQFGDNLPLHQLSAAELDALDAQATAQNVVVEVGTRRLTTQHIASYLQLAQRLRSPFLRVVIDDADYHPSVETVISVVQSLLPLCRETGVRLGIENHDRFPAQSLALIIQHTDPEWVGICLDTANSIGAGEGIDTVVQVLAPYTLNLHIKDIRIERVHHKMGFVVSGCPAGEGLIDIPGLVAQIRPFGRCISATLELWSDPLPDVAATVQREQAWFEQSITYLKKIGL